MKKILIEHAPSPMKLEVLRVEDWDIWEKGVSRFPWQYGDTETCYLLEGEAVITDEDGEAVVIREGDLVTFLPGLSCIWDIYRPVRKHFKLG